MADTTAAPAPAPTRPTQPDEALYKENLAKAEKEHKEAMAKFNAIKQKLQFASSNKNSEDPMSKRRREIEDQLSEIRSKQGVGKNSRATKLDEIKRLGEQVKARRSELVAFQKSFGTEQDLDKQLQALRDDMESGKLKVAEETKAQDDIKRLSRKRSLFQDADKKQKAIDNLESKIKEIKDSMNNPEAKELSERYTTLQNELDGIKAEQNKARGNRDNLYHERNKLQKEQEEKWQAKKKLQDEYHQQKKAFLKYDNEQKQKARERRQAEQERYDKERKLERAQKMLAEASDPAYLDEIRRANSLLQYFDPSFVAEKAPLQPSANLQAQAERKVDASDLKGVKILSKKDRDEDFFPAQKKGKKGKKHNAAATKSIFNCPPSVLEDCSNMGIDPPMSADEVPGVIEKVKAKLDHWKADQAAQTQKNIEKAKKEIEKIEAEEAKENGGKKSFSGTATPNGDAAAPNGEKSGDKVEDVTKEVEETTIEDKKEEAVAAA